VSNSRLHEAKVLIEQWPRTTMRSDRMLRSVSHPKRSCRSVCLPFAALRPDQNWKQRPDSNLIRGQATANLIRMEPGGESNKI
jgi:hypothetical protein